jgi:hypothetical protein
VIGAQLHVDSSLSRLTREPGRVVFSDGPKLRGVAYDLFARLAEQYRHDDENRIAKSKYSFVGSKELRNIFGIDEERLRKRVLAARASLKTQFSNAVDYLIDEQDIIQSRRWSGYRLNPLRDARRSCRPARLGGNRINRRTERQFRKAARQGSWSLKSLNFFDLNLSRLLFAAAYHEGRVATTFGRA